MFLGRCVASADRPQPAASFQEYCPRTLREVLDGPGVFAESAWEVLRQILEGLANIHSQGMIHRDLKQVPLGDPGLAPWAVVNWSLCCIPSFAGPPTSSTTPGGTSSWATLASQSFRASRGPGMGPSGGSGAASGLPRRCRAWAPSYARWDPSRGPYTTGPPVPLLRSTGPEPWAPATTSPPRSATSGPPTTKR